MSAKDWAMEDSGTDPEVRLTLRGQNAGQGIGLSDLESFIDAFIGALRDYDRALRGEETQKAGHPDKRAMNVSALRLLRLEPGSVIATVVADRGDEADALDVGDTPLALSTLSKLADDLAAERRVAPSVLRELERARVTCGEDGTIELQLPEGLGPSWPVLVDRERLTRLAERQPPKEPVVTSISGRLFSVNLEPDSLAIRAPDGVVWACRYDEALESQIRELLGEVVWAGGEGRRTSALRGTMAVSRIDRTVQGRQTDLFSHEHVAAHDLLAQQGVVDPQGLAGLVDEEWTGDEADERYLTALLGDG
jgi:hypothetical protein